MSETILIIEDDVLQADVVRILLEHSGFNVVHAMDGVEGLRRLYEIQPDLVVLDLMLPQVDGWEVCRRIREMSTVPIIIMTSRRSDEEKVKGLRMGADDYVVKPFNPQELAARIQAVLRRTRLPPPSKTTVMRFSGGDLIVDPANLTVVVDGKPIELTPTEFTILEVLMRAVGRIVSRDELSAVLYQRETTPYERSLDVHVSHLRRKLEDVGWTAIRTVRGQGYICVVKT